MFPGAVQLPASAGTLEKEYAPQTPDEAWNPLFVEALQKKPYTEYLLDILCPAAWRNVLPWSLSMEKR